MLQKGKPQRGFESQPRVAANAVTLEKNWRFEDIYPSWGRTAQRRWLKSRSSGLNWILENSAQKETTHVDP
jgi:hypothetical protein